MSFKDLPIEEIHETAADKNMAVQKKGLEELINQKNLEFLINKALQTQSIENPLLAASYVMAAMKDERFAFPDWMQTKAAEFFQSLYQRLNSLEEQLLNNWLRILKLEVLNIRMKGGERCE